MNTTKANLIILLPKIVGQGIASNFQTASKKTIAWNILYVVIYFLIFIWTLYSTPYIEDKFGYKGYSFISQIKYCVQLYGSSFFLAFINLRVTYYRNDILHVYMRLFDMLSDFKKLNITLNHNAFDYIIFMVTGLLLSTPVALIIDVIQTPRSLSVFLWICLYIPGFSCVLYACDYIAMFSGCANRFGIINNTLEEYCCPEMSCTQIYNLRKKHVKPHPLLKTLPNEDINLLDKLLILHDETCQLTQLLNKTCGLELAIQFGLTSATLISLGYTVALDLIAVSRGDPISEVNTRACDFWGVINIFALAAITTATSKVKENYEKTPGILHKLFNIYPELEPFAEIYSLQLSHQDATVTAGKFFTLDKTILLGLLSSWITYLIILIQFSK